MGMGTAWQLSSSRKRPPPSVYAYARLNEHPSIRTAAANTQNLLAVLLRMSLTTGNYVMGHGRRGGGDHEH